MKPINDAGLDLIKRFEGFRAIAYLCPAGVWTIGYGHTKTAKQGMKIDQTQAEALLAKDLEYFQNRVAMLVKVPLTDNQYAALVSFEFNTGALAKSTLLKKLNAGDYNSVPHEMMKWVKATDPKTKKKVTLSGLVNRRAAEVGLWSQGIMADPLPPTTQVEAYDKPVITRESVAIAGAAVPAIGATMSEVSSAGSGPIEWAVAIVIVLAFALAAYWFYTKRKNRA